MLENPSLLNLHAFFPYQFSILAGQISNYIAKIYREKYGLSNFEWRVIATVGQHQKISAKDVCEFTQLEKMQVSRAISKLSDSGVICQQKSSEDRRASLLTLSTLGQEMYQEIIPLVISQEQKMLSGLTAQECKQLIFLTKKLSGCLSTK
jgi:DNA-binding MarR family transcriptional regulator